MNDSERPHAFEVQFDFALFRYISATVWNGPLTLAKKSALSLK